MTRITIRHQGSEAHRPDVNRISIKAKVTDDGSIVPVDAAAFAEMFKDGEQVRFRIAPTPTKETERLLVESTLPGRFDRDLLVSVANALGESLWYRPPVYSDGAHDRGVLLTSLLSSIESNSESIEAFGGPVRKVTRRQLNAVRHQAGQLADAIRGLPADVRYLMGLHAGLVCRLPHKAKDEKEELDLRWNRDIESEFLPRLERLRAEAERWLKGERKQPGPRAHQTKVGLEDRLAYLLVLHGVPLAKSKNGVLAKVLRAGYDELWIPAGGNTEENTFSMGTLKRLYEKWTPKTVAEEAARAKGQNDFFSKLVDDWKNKPGNKPVG